MTCNSMISKTFQTSCRDLLFQRISITFYTERSRKLVKEKISKIWKILEKHCSQENLDNLRFSKTSRISINFFETSTSYRESRWLESEFFDNSSRISKRFLENFDLSKFLYKKFRKHAVDIRLLFWLIPCDDLMHLSTKYELQTCLTKNWKFSKNCKNLNYLDFVQGVYMLFD